MPGSDLQRKSLPLYSQAIISTCRKSILLFCTFKMPAAQADQTLLQTVLALLSFALHQVDASLLTLLNIGRPQLHAIASRTIGSTLMFPITQLNLRDCALLLVWLHMSGRWTPV